MENSVSTKLINSISNFDLLSSSNAARVELVMKYCQKIDEILDPLKPVLDEVVSQISSDKKLNKVLEELDAATNEAKELIRSWHQMISKIYFVMQIESIVAKIQACSLDLCQLVHSLVPPPAANCTATCVEKLQQISCENISIIIREVSSELSRKVMSKSEILAKISNSLCLSTNLELLMEAVALDRIKMKGGSCEGRVELDNINHIVELIDYMHDNFVGKKQLHSIGGVPIPADFCCPLSLDLMSDPVIVASGQTYERVFIRKWLDLGYNVCPKTRQTLGHTNLIPNYTVKALIENWCEINDIEVADPMKLLSLRFPASLLCHSNGSASDKSPPCSESSPRANHPRSPESNRSGSLCENSCSSLGVHQDNTMQEKSTPVHPIPKVSSLQDANGSEANFSVVSLAASKAEKESQSGEKHVGPVALKQLKEGSEKVADVDQQLHGGSSSGSGIVAVSSRNNLQQLGEDSMVAQISGDSDASGEVTQESAASTASRGEAEFPPRLGEAGLRNLSIWRRSSDRTVPRIVLSPSMDSRTDVSGVETQVRKLIENMRSDSAETHKAASAELRLLARHNMENRIVIANCGAISTLVGLLHSADPKTQENAVTTLLNLSLNDNNKIAIANAEAIDPLIHVLQTGNAEAKENSAATLFSLSVLEENKVRIGRSGAIRPLVELLGHGTPRGKKDAATALFNLSIFHENKARIVHAGAVKHLVELMDPAAGMVDKAVAVLANLATIHEGRNAIAQAGGVPVLVEVVELGSARGRENAAAALLQLCTNSNRFCSLVLQEGAVPPLVALSQSGTPRAKEKAQGLLSYFRNQRHGSATRS